MANNKILTNDFKLHQIRQFIESITEPANTIYYVFAGKPTEYLLGDTTIDPPWPSVQTLTTSTYDEMVLGKQVTENDVKPLVKRYDWETGTVYDMYDSQDAYLKDKSFFVVSPEGGAYYVFKCLDNNGGKASNSSPSFSETSADEPYYETADGYVWKYMYKIDATTFNKFSTLDYIPVIPDANVTSNAVGGAIDVIKIENTGRNYNNYLSGKFGSTDVRLNGVSVQYRLSTSSASTISDFYTGCLIKIVSGPISAAVGQYRRITGYEIVDGDGIITIDSAFNTTPTGCFYEISPEVVITGDGRQTINAVARAIINAAASNTIYKVDILNRGKNYFLGSAYAYADPSVRTSNSTNDAVLRIIFSPKGGHGYNAESELFASALGISVKISNNELNTISTDNDFRTIGLLKDPKFHNVKLTYSSISGADFIDTEQVVQAKLDRLGGSVGVSFDSPNVYGLGTLTSLSIGSEEYETTYSNTDIIRISNVVINAVCNVTTNSTGGLDSITIISAGYGFSDTVSPVLTISNTIGGNVRYFSSRVISNSYISGAGRNYNNSDVVTISSSSSSANARGTLTTNSIGSIQSITISDSGKGFSCNEIAEVQIVNAGRGYNSTVNNIVTIESGGGDGAVARFTNNATGNITSITILDGGRGYNSAPIITPAGTPTVTATFNTILRTPNLSIRIANSTGGFSNGGKITEVAVIANGSSNLYSNSDVVTFQSHIASGVNAVANLVTIPGGTLNNIVINTTAGLNYGFTIANNSTNIFATNATGGNIRFFNGPIVSSILTSNIAPHSSIVSAGFRSTTGASLSLGSNYNSTQLLRVDIVDGGIGYDSTVNNQLVFSPAGTGNLAVATFSNDLNGTITSITFPNLGSYGNGFTTAPTVTVNPEANGLGANLQAVLANQVSVTSTTGGYGAVIYFTNNAAGALSTLAVANGGFNYLSNSTITLSISGANGTGGLIEAKVHSNATFFANGDQAIVYGGLASPNAIANVSLFYGNSISDFNLRHLYHHANSSSFSAYETSATGIFFKPDGTKFFIIGSGGDEINEFSLSTPWDITTESWVANSPNLVLRGEINPHDLYMTSNGTVVYTIGVQEDKVLQFNLSQAWNVATMTYVANVVISGRGETLPTGLHFSSNGSLMYTVGTTVDAIQSWSLSTPWDITTATYLANSTFGSGSFNPSALSFDSTGSVLYTIETQERKIARYTLNTPWDITTINVASKYTHYVIQENIPQGLFVQHAQSSIYVVGSSIVRRVQQYKTLPTYKFNMLNSGLNFNSSNINLIISNSVIGNTTHVNGIIVRDITVSNGGYQSFCTNNDILYVTNGRINAIANVVANSSGHLTSVVVKNSGKGFVNNSTINMFLVNSTAGDVRYLNTNVVSSIAVSDGGVGYKNTDYIVVTSPGATPATANIQTTVDGTIETISLTNRGRNIIPWRIDSLEIVNGGTSYSNADIIQFCGGGGTGANGILMTNSSGGITKVYLVNKGINYDCAPTVEIANSIGGTANGSGANLIATIIKPSTFRIYNSSGAPSTGNFADLQLTVRPSAIVNVNLVIAPSIGSTSKLVEISNPATLETIIGESANLVFTSKITPNVSINLSNQATTFDSSLFADDYVFLQTSSVGEIHQINNVVNSTLLILKSLPSFTNTGVAISSARITAQGNVLDQANGYIKVTNASGFFNVNTNVLGISSRTYANVSLVSYNDISKPIPTTINQLFNYKLQTVSGSFEEDETIYSGNTITGNSTAKYHSGNTSSMFVTNETGLFYSGELIRGQTSGASAVLATGDTYKYEGDLIRGSGEIIYIENIEPINRSNNQSETIKLILEF